MTDFRKVVADEFNELWAIDLKGNARTSGERRRQEGGNIFDDKIRVGVAIYFLVRRQGDSGFKVFYNAVKDYAKAPDKANYIQDKPLATFDFVEITPSADGQWINQSNSDFDNLIILADRQIKSASAADGGHTVFDLFSNGAKANRDEWVYDFDVANLRRKVLFFTDVYNGLLDSNEKSYDPTIKWSSTLRDRFHRNGRIVYSDANRIQSLYRPFVVMHHFTDVAMNDIAYPKPLRNVWQQPTPP